MSEQSISSALSGSADQISDDLAAAIAREHFGLAGHAALLTGERDQNFLLRTAHAKFVLKISHPDEDRGAIDFQTAALLCLAQSDPELPTPRIIRTRDGRSEAVVRDSRGAARVARVLSFLPGVMAAGCPVSPKLRLAIGHTLARFDRALAQFAHPADSFDLSWDIVKFARLRPMLSGVADPADRANVERALDRFDGSIAPVLPGLRHQVIHNDLNPYNILVSEEEPGVISGVLDFGDMIRAPLVNDLAIASAYHVGQGGEALTPVLEIVGAYSALNPLTAEESDLLYDLIATRLAMTVLITEWRAARHPENRAYILKNHPAAVRGLIALRGIARTDAQARFRRASGQDI
ncbi:MAG: phosphotransferase [Proteobacteria bacterium]|nr:phosphotransferase [Pseudomonadota bacterium]